MIGDFILKVVVKELLPKPILLKFHDTSVLINFIKKAIKSSAIYVKGPEIFLRFFLFFLILFLKILQIISFKFITVEYYLEKISQLHPILNDGMRLYILLAMFAAFEDDKVRVDNGFLPVGNLPQSFKKFKL